MTEKPAASPQPKLCSANPTPIPTPKTTANSPDNIDHSRSRRFRAGGDSC